MGEGQWLVHNMCGDNIKWVKTSELQHPSWNPPWSQDKLANALKNLSKNGFDPKYPLTVSIEKDGTLLVFDGNHRLAAARILGILEVAIMAFYAK